MQSLVGRTQIVAFLLQRRDALCRRGALGRDRGTLGQELRMQRLH